MRYRSTPLGSPKAPISFFHPVALGLVLASLLLQLACGASEPDWPYPVESGPPLLTFDELLTLSDTPEEKLPAELAARLRGLLTTPFVNNRSALGGVQPHRPDVGRGHGPGLRAVSWNVARGRRFELLASVFGDGSLYRRELEDEGRDDPPKSEERERIDVELELLSEADVIVLQEADWGMRRSGYRAVVTELASALQMNWAFAVEFVEVDPLHLGTERFEDADEEDREALRQQISVDQGRYRGLHGTAVLSRYPIARARVIPLKSQPYDWFAEELDGVSLIESAKREATEEIFLTPVGREIRRGGRTLLLAELAVAGEDVEGGRLTVAAAHLESRSTPEERQEQLAEMLGYIGDIDHPVILAGDMNTSGQDGTPTNWKRELTRRVGDEEFWAKTALKYLTGVGIVFDAVVSGVSFLRKSDDPTVDHVPVLSPNEESEFFDMLEDFRFADGKAFDFRGDPERSVGGEDGNLANSNQRDDKGFVVTYEVERTIGPAGKLKLDWIFVKSYATDPEDPSQPYRLAPHFGRTMEALNNGLPERISDHAPISVDLPFGSP